MKISRSAKFSGRSSDGDHKAVESEQLSVRTKLAFGIGGFLDNIGQHSINVLALPVFNVALGLNPALVGVAMMIFRLWDAFTDPTMGSVSDATRSRFGRRRPWMMLGAVLCGVLFPFLWRASPEWSPTLQAGYFVVIGIFYFTAFTIFSVPYHALAFEMTPDYHEKTSVMAYRTTINGIAAIAVGWLYAITQLPVFGGTISGVRITSIGIGIVLLICGVIPAWFTKERYFKKVCDEKPVPFLKSIRLTLSSRPFLILTAMGVAILGGEGATKSLGLYLNIYYVHGGATAPASVIQGFMGTVFAIVSVLSIPLLAVFSKRIGKHQTLCLCLGLGIASSIANWFCITPEHPWLQMVPVLFVAPGIMGFWLMFSSMTADICDYDELKNGARREGMFSAVYAWIAKVSVSMSLGLSGVVIALTGFDQEFGGEQPAGAMLRMRIIYTAVPVACYLLSFFAVRFYELNHTVMKEVRTALEERRGVL